MLRGINIAILEYRHAFTLPDTFTPRPYRAGTVADFDRISSAVIKSALYL
jgi:hypothetical protein